MAMLFSNSVDVVKHRRLDLRKASKFILAFHRAKKFGIRFSRLKFI